MKNALRTNAVLLVASFLALISATVSAQGTSLCDLELHQEKGQWDQQELRDTDRLLLLGNHRPWLGKALIARTASSEDCVARVLLDGRYSQLTGTLISPYILSNNDGDWRNLSPYVSSVYGSILYRRKPTRGVLIVEADGKQIFSKDIGCDDGPERLDLALENAKVLTLRAVGPIALVDANLFRIAEKQESTKIVFPDEGATIREASIKLDWAPRLPGVSYLAVLTPQLLDDPSSLPSFAGALAQAPTATGEIDLRKLPTGPCTIQMVGFSGQGVVVPYSTPESIFIGKDAPALTPPKVRGSRDVAIKPENIGPAVCMFPTYLPLIGGCRLANGQWGFESPSGMLCADALFENGCDWVHFDTGSLLLNATYGTTEPFVEVYADGERVFRRSISAHREFWIPTFGAHSVEVRGVKMMSSGEFYHLESPELKGPKDRELCTGPHIWCRWGAQPDADFFLVRAVCTRATDRLNASSKLTYFALATGGRSDLILDLTGYPPGWYEWQVLSYKDGKVIGTWSEPFQFKLAPK